MGRLKDLIDQKNTEISTSTVAPTFKKGRLGASQLTPDPLRTEIQPAQTSAKGRIGSYFASLPVSDKEPLVKKEGFISKTVGDIKALGTGEVSAMDVLKEIPSETIGITKTIANTFIPAIKNFIEQTGSIFGEGLAYAIDPIVREQYLKGNLDILPTISETTTKDVVLDTFAAGIETAVYMSFPEMAKAKLLKRGGMGAIQGVGFAISDGIAKDKKVEEIIKELPLYGIPAAVLSLITPYLTSLLRAEMRQIPTGLRNIFKGITTEVRTGAAPGIVLEQQEVARVASKISKIEAEQAVVRAKAVVEGVPYNPVIASLESFQKTEIIKNLSTRLADTLGSSIPAQEASFKLIKQELNVDNKTTQTILDSLNGMKDVGAIENRLKSIIRAVDDLRVVPEKPIPVKGVAEVAEEIVPEKPIFTTTFTRKGGESVITNYFGRNNNSLATKIKAELFRFIRTTDNIDDVRNAIRQVGVKNERIVNAKAKRIMEAKKQSPGFVDEIVDEINIKSIIKMLDDLKLPYSKAPVAGISVVQKAKKFLTSKEFIEDAIGVKDLGDKTKINWLNKISNEERIQIQNQIKDLRMYYKEKPYRGIVEDVLDDVWRQVHETWRELHRRSSIGVEKFLDEPLFKKLTQTVDEIKPVGRTTTVSREQLPVGTGARQVSKLEARIRNIVGDATESSINRLDEGGASTYQVMNKAEQIKAATVFVEKYPDDALRVLKGEIMPPEGLLHNSIAIALEQKAEMAADAALSVKLSSLRSTRAGQEISILTEVDQENPITFLNDIIKARTARAEKAVPKGSTIAKEISKEAKKAVKESNKFKLKLSEVEVLLNDILC